MPSCISPSYSSFTAAAELSEINEDEGTWINLTKSLRFAGLGNDIKLRLFSNNGDEKLIEITPDQTKRIN